jgi:hypothetical protein
MSVIRLFRNKNAVLLLFVLGPLMADSQIASGDASPRKRGYEWQLSAGLGLPVSRFFETHFPGAGLALHYLPALTETSPLRRRKTAFTALLTLDSWRGQEERSGGAMFRYPALWMSSLQAGLVNQSLRPVRLHLTGGPGLGLYDGRIKYYHQARLQAAWYPTSRTGILPGILWMQEPGTRSLWALSAQALFRL